MTTPTASAALNLVLFALENMKVRGKIPAATLDGVLAGTVVNHATSGPEPEVTILREQLLAKMWPEAAKPIRDQFTQG